MTVNFRFFFLFLSVFEKCSSVDAAVDVVVVIVAIELSSSDSDNEGIDEEDDEEEEEDECDELLLLVVIASLLKCSVSMSSGCFLATSLRLNLNVAEQQFCGGSLFFSLSPPVPEDDLLSRLTHLRRISLNDSKSSICCCCSSS